MKIYNLVSAHRTKKDVYVAVKSFLDLSDAAKEYEKSRKIAIEMARDEDPDSDEEVFRDFDVTESGYHFRCYVPEDEELFAVELIACDAH